MSIRLEDVKERVFSIAKEFKGQRMGMVGFSIILFMLIIGILAPWIAPDVDGEWASISRWEDNPRGAQPVWIDYILPGTRARHEIREDPDHFDEGRLELFYNYTNDYDYPVSDVSIRIHGRSNMPEVRMFVNLQRPDGHLIHFARGDRISVSEQLQFTERGDEVFTFELDEFATRSYMQEGRAGRPLREAFSLYGIALSGPATVTAVEDGWIVEDGIYEYFVSEPEEELAEGESAFLDVHPSLIDSFTMDLELKDDLYEDQEIHRNVNVSRAFRDQNAELTRHATITEIDDDTWVINDGIFIFTISEAQDELIVDIDIDVGDDLFEFNMNEILQSMYLDTISSHLQTAFSNAGFDLTEYANITETDQGWFIKDGIFEYEITESDMIDYRMDVDVDVLEEEELFVLDEDIEEFLPVDEEETVHENVTAAFGENGFYLSSSATINVSDEGWEIRHEPYIYDISDDDFSVRMRLTSFDIDVEFAELAEEPIHENVTAAFDDNGISLSNDATITEIEDGWRIDDGIFRFYIDGALNVETGIQDFFVFDMNVDFGIEYAFDQNGIILPTRADIWEPDYASWQVDDRAFNYTIHEVAEHQYKVDLQMRDPFRFDLDYERFLEEGSVSSSVEDLFDRFEYELSTDAELLGQEGMFWKIIDNVRDRSSVRYFIEDKGDLTAAVYRMMPEEYVGFSEDRGSEFTLGTSLLNAFQANGIDLPADTIMVQRDDRATTWHIRDGGGYMIRMDYDGLRILSLESFSYVFNLRSALGRGIAYNFGLDFHEADRVPLQPQVNNEMIPFAVADENILLNPESLKGDYVLYARAYDATELDEETTRAIFRGRRYGLMGTDTSRRDLALGWVWGARWALLLGAIISISSVSLALLYGMTSAYYGGWVDEFMQRLNEVLIGIPMFPILIITMFILGRSIWIFVAVYTILGWRGLAKIIRSRGIQIRQDTYIEAAQSLGSSGGRVITRHMIPQLLPYAIAEGALMIPMVIIAEAGLSVLGLGDPHVVTWGRMLSQAHTAGATTAGLWWWVLLPGLGITLVGFAFIATGMALERVINPKMRQR